ncbi:MAG: HEAT repeat domain-containing protein [Planctomycetes bacterium]|nr:HEAT repeat domain-containing protein [Planctomycetota bacterium]
MSDWFAQCRGYGSSLPFMPGDTRSQFLPDTPFRTEHVRLELDLDLERRTAACRATTSLVTLVDDVRQLAFDAVAMKILRVRSDGRTLPHRHDGKRLTVSLGKQRPAGTRLDLVVDYRLTDPKGGLHFAPAVRARAGAPGGPRPRGPQVWTQGQTDDARCWFPCHDVPAEKATTEVLATVPEGFRAVSNGVLVAERPAAGRGKRTFHWRMDRPHSLYLVTLTVGRFGEVREEWDGIPILYYCEEGREDEVRRGFGKTPPAVRFFSEYTGVRYPYEKYAQIAAADFLGGMENTSATTQTDVALLDARAALDVDFDGLVAHELAHQWFGDLVTCREWSHAWLNESFATYFEVLFAEEDKGEDEARYELWRYASDYFDEHDRKYARPTVTRQWRESFQLFDCHLYQRGACVLHFLRRLVGESAWRKAIRHYLERHGHGSVETRDLIEAFRTATGRNLDRYFEEWLFRAGHPELRATLAWDAKAKEATLHVTQKGAIGGNGKSAYQFPIGVRFVTRDGTQDFREELKDAEHVFKYRLPSEPRQALLDPDYELPLVKVDWLKPRALWRNQLLGDRDVAGRLAAAGAVADWGTDEAAELLGRAFAREKFWGVRAELARGLGRMRTPAARAVLVRNLGVTEPKARRAVVEALGEYRDASLVATFARLAERDPSYMVAAEAVRALGKTRDARARAHIERALATDSWGEVLRGAGVSATVELAGTWTAARKYLAAAFPDRVRAAAVRAIGAAGRGEPGATLALLEAARGDSQLVRVTAVRTLVLAGDPSACAELKKLHEGCGNSMERGVLDSALRSLRSGLATDPPKAVRGKAAAGAGAMKRAVGGG